MFITLISGICTTQVSNTKTPELSYNLTSHIRLAAKPCSAYLLIISQTYASLDPYPISFGL